MLSWNSLGSLVVLFLLSCAQNLVIARPDPKPEGQTGPHKAAAPILAKQEIKDLKEDFAAEETGFNSCEMCADYDGKGQCVVMTKGQSKQSICLPYYAREPGCHPGICGQSSFCREDTLAPNGKKFFCKMKDSGIKGKNNKFFKKESECTKCDKKTGADTTTMLPTCMLINSIYACIKPTYYPDEKTLTCNDSLCPKYSQCKAIKKKSGDREYFLLKCLFDTTLLPHPPSTVEIQKSLVVVEKILEEIQIKNNQMANITGVEVGGAARNQIRKSIETACPEQHPSKAVQREPSSTKGPVFFRIRRKRETALNRMKDKTTDTLTCLIQENVVAQSVESNYFTELLNGCSGGGGVPAEPGQEDSSVPLQPPECKGIDKETEPDRELLCRILSAKKNQNKLIKKDTEILKQMAQKGKAGGEETTEQSSTPTTAKLSSATVSKVTPQTELKTVRIRD